MKKFLNSGWFWALLPMAAALATAAYGGIGFQPFPDSADYLALGKNFMSGFERGTAVAPGWRAPGYPALLWFAGLAAGKYAYLAVNLVSLYFLTVLLLNMAQELKLNRAVVLALIAGSAGIPALAASALSEMPFMLFVMLNLELLRRREYLCSAAMLAMATAIRPAALLLWIPELLFALILLRPRMKWWKAVLFILTANLLVLVWCVRNQAIWGHFAYTSHEGHYIYFYKVASSMANAGGYSIDNARIICAAKLAQDMERRGEYGGDIFSANAVAAQQSLDYIRDHKGDFFMTMLSDLQNFWLPDITPLLERLGITAGNRGTLDVLHSEGLGAAVRAYFGGANWKVATAVAVYCVWYLAFILLTAAGIIRMAMGRHWRMLAAVLLTISYFWLLPAGNLDWRFRMAVQPVLILCAAYAVSRRRQHGSGQQSGATSGN
ncbi:MAG: hypothetical protein AB7F40_02615 [Victivallaceae bacterium]|nr:hypothetical protein [Victivallaceae bacterium]